MALVGAAAAATFAKGGLAAVGVGTGLLVTALVLLVDGVAFLAFVRQTMDKDLRSVGRRRRRLYVGGVVLFCVIVVAVGVVTRPVKPVARLTGTQDIGIVGFSVADDAQQQTFDDVAAALRGRLEEMVDDSVHDYTGEVEADLDGLTSQSGRARLGAWAQGFVRRTSAELVLGGYAQARPDGQTLLDLAIYVSPALIADAPELVGWYLLDEIRVDRGLSSAQARRSLLDRAASAVDAMAA